MNEGRTEHCFLAASHRGKLRLGGPERGRQSVNNVYKLEWVDAERMEDIPLHPSHARRVCRDLLKYDRPTEGE